MRVRDALLPLAAAIGLGVAAYGAYLVLVGQVWLVIREGPHVGFREYTPTLVGLLPLAAGLIVVLGVALKKRVVGWTGWALMTTFGVAFVFGIGGVVLSAAVVLGLALLAADWRRGRSLAAK